MPARPIPFPNPSLLFLTLPPSHLPPHQDWPNTCLLNVGHHQYPAFSDLYNHSGASDFLAVSCGPNGYIPEPDEWDSNRDYFAAPPQD